MWFGSSKHGLLLVVAIWGFVWCPILALDSLFWNEFLLNVLVLTSILLLSIKSMRSHHASLVHFCQFCLLRQSGCLSMAYPCSLDPVTLWYYLLRYGGPRWSKFWQSDISNGHRRDLSRSIRLIALSSGSSILLRLCPRSEKRSLRCAPWLGSWSSLISHDSALSAYILLL